MTRGCMGMPARRPGAPLRMRDRPADGQSDFISRESGAAGRAVPVPENNHSHIEQANNTIVHDDQIGASQPMVRYAA